MNHLALIANKCNLYCIDKHILSHLQYGFIKNKSNTKYAAFDLLHKIQENLNGRNKSFDTVNHNILLYNLKHLCILETTVNLLKSYLINRLQVFVMNGTQSKC